MTSTSGSMLLVFAGAIALSCGETDTNARSNGSDPPPGSAASVQQINALCAAQCDHDESCPEPDVKQDPQPDCRQTCVDKIGTKPAYRSAAIEAMSACFEGLACGESDDQCTVKGVNAITSEPQRLPQWQACSTRHDACESDPTGGFSDDLCVSLILLTPDAADAFESCLAGPCAAVSRCFYDITGSARAQ